PLAAPWWGGLIAWVGAGDSREPTLPPTPIMATSGKPGLPIIAKPDVAAKLPPPAPEGDTKAYIEGRVKWAQLVGSPGYPIDEKRLREQATADVERSYYPAGDARHAAVALVAG